MNIIDRTFEEIHGEICWGFDFGRYTNLSFNIGKPELEISRQPSEKVSQAEVRRRVANKDWQLRPVKARRVAHVEGRWQLRVYMAYWKISSHGVVVATSSSPARGIGAATMDLDGQKLTGVHVNAQTGATTFTFDLGSVLEVRRFEKTSKDELWILREPSGYYLSMRGDGTYDHGPGSGLDNRPGVKQRPLEQPRELIASRASRPQPTKTRRNARS